MTLRLLCAFAAFTVATAAVAQPAPQTARIRGEIVSVDGDKLSVKRAGTTDTVMIDFKSDVPVGAVKNVPLAGIKPGAFVGIASLPGADGKLVAKEVHVFPEALRGTGEGHHDWDLLPNSSMTNANVDTAVQANNGRELTLSYKGGTKTIAVPADTPVVTFIDATRADVIKGKKVFIVARPTGPGQYAANRVIVEKDGVAPPM